MNSKMRWLWPTIDSCKARIWIYWEKFHLKGDTHAVQSSSFYLRYCSAQQKEHHLASDYLHWLSSQTSTELMVALCIKKGTLAFRPPLFSQQHHFGLAGVVFQRHSAGGMGGFSLAALPELCRNTDIAAVVQALSHTVNWRRYTHWQTNPPDLIQVSLLILYLTDISINSYKL